MHLILFAPAQEQKDDRNQNQQQEQRPHADNWQDAVAGSAIALSCATCLLCLRLRVVKICHTDIFRLDVDAFGNQIGQFFFLTIIKRRIIDDNAHSSAL